MAKKVFFFLMLALSVPGIAAESNKELGIRKGNMAVGGKAAVNYFSSEINYYGGFYADIEGSYAYFLIDGLAIGANLGVVTTIHRLAVAPIVSLGVSLEYFFKTGSIVYPYLGAGVGFAWKPVDPTSPFLLPVKPEAGVLIALSNAVALDLGINLTMTFPLVGNTLPLLDGTAGFVGVRAFF